MLDLKVINAVLEQLEEERGVPKDKAIEAIEEALATAYKKEYGKRGQIINAYFDPEAGGITFEQVKIVVDKDSVYMPDESSSDDETRVNEKGSKASEDTQDDSSEEESESESTEEEKIRFNPERHIFIEDAQRIKKDAQVEEEIVFPLEEKDEYGRISAQTAKQVIIQKIREAEKSSYMAEFEDKQGEIVSGTVQRVERGNLYIDLGRVTGILPYEEQIPGERFKQGERIRALLFSVEETSRGIFLRLSRSRPEFLERLFEMEAPEVANGIVEIMAIAREPGARSKVAVMSNDEYVDPVGSLVGQRGVRVATVMSELGNEKIDIVEWSSSPEIFVEEALSPAQALSVDINEEDEVANVLVAPDQQSLAIGKGGQNARLAAKLTGLKIDISSTDDDEEDDETQESTDDKEVDDPTASEDDQTSADEEAGENPSTDAQDDSSEEESETKAVDADGTAELDQDLAEEMEENEKESNIADIDETNAEDSAKPTPDDKVPESVDRAHKQGNLSGAEEELAQSAEEIEEDE